MSARKFRSHQAAMISHGFNSIRIVYDFFNISLQYANQIQYFSAPVNKHGLRRHSIQASEVAGCKGDGPGALLPLELRFRANTR